MLDKIHVYLFLFNVKKRSTKPEYHINSFHQYPWIQNNFPACIKKIPESNFFERLTVLINFI